MSWWFGPEKRTAKNFERNFEAGGEISRQQGGIIRIYIFRNSRGINEINKNM